MFIYSVNVHFHSLKFIQLPLKKLYYKTAAKNWKDFESENNMLVQACTVGKGTCYSRLNLVYGVFK